MSWEMRKEAEMNEENLRPFSERTESEQREIRRRGGKKSGEKRRLRKSFREATKYLLNEKDENGETAIYRIVMRMIAEAESGSTKAAEFLRDTSGEKPAEKIEAAMQPVRIIDTTGDGD